MILSFHPIYEGDRNRLCAGRDPDAADLAAMAQAAAVILPQACRRSLYEAACRRCARVFPNYTARFAYPGKAGQIRLFRQMGAPHPRSLTYADTSDFLRRHPAGEGPFPPPAVVKLNWGGEGQGVFPIRRPDDMRYVLNILGAYERTGQCGFIYQQWIPAGGRSLRVVVTGGRTFSYWRVMPSQTEWVTNLARGGKIDRTSDPHLIAAAETATTALCRQTGIDLAGFDLLFSTDPSVANPVQPLFLEINYYFGRRGFSGSEAYYQWLILAIDAWLKRTAPPPKGALPA